MYPGLSLDQAPPILVPFRFFLTAPLFGILASLFALYIGDEIFASRWLPSILSLTHLFTLGIISMVMVGALFQMLPVVAGAALIAETLVSRIVHACLVTGTLFLTGGLYQNIPWAINLALIALAIGLLSFIMATSYALWRAPRSHDSVKGMRLAITMGLLITLLLGLILGFGHSDSETPLLRELLTRPHLLWGALGWVSLLVAVIAYQVVPMFQMTPEYPSWIRRYWARVLIGLLIAASYAEIFIPILVEPIGILLAVTLLAFAVTTLRLQRKRKRRLPDVTLNFWRLGMGALITSVAVYVLNLFWPQPPLSLLIGTLFFIGFALSVINGMLYKIVPFLVWLHLQNQLLSSMQLGKIKIPNMKKIIPDHLSKRQYWLHTSAFICLIISVFAGNPVFQISWSLFLASFLLLGFNLLIAYRCFQKELIRIALKGTKEQQQ